MKCPSCGAPENADGVREHALDCELVGSDPLSRALAGMPDSVTRTEPPPADTRVLQFTGHLTLHASGLPLQLDVLINGRLASTYDVSEASELSVGDAVDLALANEGRRVMSAPLA